MEKRISTKIDAYVSELKTNVRNKILSMNLEKDQMNELAEFITEYSRLSLDKDDFIRRKRVKNAIPQNNRCNALRANGEQCTRRRRDDCEFCGTHYKGTPHGLVNGDEVGVAQECAKQNVELVVEDIGGIVYYLDKNNNVYNTEDVLRGTENPAVIGKYDVGTKKITFV